MNPVFRAFISGRREPGDEVTYALQGSVSNSLFDMNKFSG